MDKVLVRAAVGELFNSGEKIISTVHCNENQNSDTTIKPAKDWVTLEQMNQMDFSFKDNVFHTLFPSHSKFFYEFFRY